MSTTTFSFPAPTLFGAGALAELPGRCERLGLRRPLVVTDPGLLSTPAFRALANTLGEAGQDKEWFLYSGVHPNPVEQDVRDAAEAFRRHDCDSVVAIGGGSPLDAGKAARLLVKRPGFDLGRFYTASDWSGLAPLVAIP
ncbi:MAG TPA: iron-containing alcohol dehydrogenase, partial [Verrucomicrobiae bacterium]